MSTKESHPITRTDLERFKNNIDSRLKSIQGRDLSDIFRAISADEPRIQPEEAELVFVVRDSCLLFCYFTDLLMDRTGKRHLIEQPKHQVETEVQRRANFIAAYSFFVMGSYIAAKCEEILSRKERTRLAKLNTDGVKLVIGRDWADNFTKNLEFYTQAIGARSSGVSPAQTAADVVAVTRDYWVTIAKKAAEAAKGDPELLALIENSTFTFEKDFLVTGLTATRGEANAKVVTFAKVEPNEVVGDPDVTLALLRICDRLPFYDTKLGKNPFCEFGGMIESVLLDGPPGTGKTLRQRLMMTRIEKLCQLVDLQYRFKAITASQVKDQFYGNTAAKITAILTIDPMMIELLFFDDIDLLLTGDRNSPGTNSADLDIMKAIMDFMSGIGTNYNGGYIVLAATNKPTGLDDAPRQRFAYRALILGPKTAEDFADLAFHKLKGFGKTGLLGVSNFDYQPLSRNPKGEQVENSGGIAILRVNRSWLDIGKLCEELNKKDPKFTGRAVDNAIKVAIARASDFDVPEEWFTNPDVFRNQSWEKRVEMVRALYGTPLTTDKIMMALEHQFEVEQRYQREEFEKKVEAATEEMSIGRAVMEKMQPVIEPVDINTPSE